MPKRCKDCNKVSLPNDEGLSAETCQYCDSSNLECDHPSSNFDKQKQCFVCGACGHEDHQSVAKLRKSVTDYPFLNKIIDTNTH